MSKTKRQRLTLSTLTCIQLWVANCHNTSVHIHPMTARKTMLFTVGLTHDAVAIQGGLLFAIGMALGFLAAVLLPAQRWLLWYVCGGVLYVLGVAVIHSSLVYFAHLSTWYSYVLALGISWLPLFAWVLYRALRYDDVSGHVAQARKAHPPPLLEHTPVYGDDFEPRFE